MAQAGFTPIRLYHSTTTTNVPAAGNLAFGELAVNTADGKLYYKNSATNLVALLADASSVTGNLPGGGTGTVVYQSSTGNTAYLTLGTTNWILTAGSTAPQYVNPTSVSVGYADASGEAADLLGGAANRIAYQIATDSTGFVTAPVTAGTVLGWTGTAFSWVSAPAATSATNLAGGGANTVVYQSSAGNTAYLNNGTTGQVLTATTGGPPTWGSGVGNLLGGTAGQVPYQSAPGATAFAGPGTTGQPLLSNGATAPTFGTLPVGGGGTGRANMTAGSVLVGNGTAAVSLIAPSTAGNILTSTGTTWASSPPAAPSVTRAFVYFCAQF